MIAPSGERRAAGASYLTWLCCALCVVMTLGYWFVGVNGQPAGWGALPAEAIWSGRYGALVTAVFVHASPLQNPFHLIFNVLWLARLGDAAERAFGHLEWAVFFLVAAVVSSATELAIFTGDAIGASGVVYALFGLVWGSRRSIPAFQLIASDYTVRLMLGWLVLCFVLTETGKWNIANGAHAGGLLFGLAVAWLFVEKPLPASRRAVAAVVLVALLVLTVLSVTYLPWSARWQRWQQFRALTTAQAPATLAFIYGYSPKQYRTVSSTCSRTGPLILPAGAEGNREASKERNGKPLFAGAARTLIV